MLFIFFNILSSDIEHPRLCTKYIQSMMREIFKSFSKFVLVLAAAVRIKNAFTCLISDFIEQETRILNTCLTDLDNKKKLHFLL